MLGSSDYLLKKWVFKVPKVFIFIFYFTSASHLFRFLTFSYLNFDEVSIRACLEFIRRGSSFSYIWFFILNCLYWRILKFFWVPPKLKPKVLFRFASRNFPSRFVSFYDYLWKDFAFTLWRTSLLCFKVW